MRKTREIDGLSQSERFFDFFLIGSHEDIFLDTLSVSDLIFNICIYFTMNRNGI